MTMAPNPAQHRAPQLLQSIAVELLQFIDLQRNCRQQTEELQASQNVATPGLRCYYLIPVARAPCS